MVPLRFVHTKTHENGEEKVDVYIYINDPILRAERVYIYIIIRIFSFTNTNEYFHNCYPLSNKRHVLSVLFNAFRR